MRFLFVDRITALEPRVYVEGIKHVTADDAFLIKNTKGEIIFCPSLIGETLGQLAAWNVMEAYAFQYRPVAGVVASATPIRDVKVGETITLRADIESLDETAVQYSAKAYVQDMCVFEVNGALGPMLPMGQFIDEKIVRQQFHEIYRPIHNDMTLSTQSNNQDTSIGNITSVCTLSNSLKFDRVLSVIPGKSMHAQKLVSRMAPYFSDHFPLKPVLPMTVLLACKMDLAHRFIELTPELANFSVTNLRRIKMNEFVSPGDVVDAYLSIKQQSEHECVLVFRAEVNNKRVCVLELCLQKN